jgi:CheY-like chemotaxis protein
MSQSLDIVVADDDPLLRALMQWKLEDEGHNVTLVCDGDEALCLVTSAPPDLLVLDIGMPGMDGLELIRRLRQRPETATLPVVLLTGRDTDPDIIAGWQSGANYYITKPFVIEHLRYFIESLPDKSAAGETGGHARVRPKVRTESVPGQPVSTESGFDRSMVTWILNEFGGEALHELLDIFRLQAPALVETACIAIGVGNAEDAGRAAHTLKSSAATIGATELAALCVDLEAKAQSGSIVGEELVARALPDVLATVIGQLAAFEAGLTVSP